MEPMGRLRMLIMSGKLDNRTSETASKNTTKIPSPKPQALSSRDQGNGPSELSARSEYKSESTFTREQGML